MVFGNCYCAISHLEIKDGDKCMLFPLGFRMNFEFDKWNKADINSFMYLYTFIYEAQEVIFEGNYARIGYLNKEYKQTMEHEMYMLVHYKFYQELLITFFPYSLLHISTLPLFNTIYPIWEKAQEHVKRKREELTAKYFQTNQRNAKEYADAFLKIETPPWIISLYQVAMFMGHMGIMPSPNLCSDQHDMGLKYETIRAKASEQKQDA